jgi:hypothetical protein
MDEGLDDDEE